jgi:myo-inositol 2-dehydrogenase / D-chiro-inositol 1-dehydrogenase
MAETVTLGFVGTGGIARHHLNELAKLPEVRIGAVCDVVEERAREVAASHGGAVYTDYRAMLDHQKLDGLYVCVPPAMHRAGPDGAPPVEVLAAERGVHLFVEKPVCLELETGIEIRDAIARMGILSCVGYGVRYSAASEATRRFCAGRTVGMVACDRWGGIPGDATHWWRRMEISGGQLHEMATHQLDLIRWFAGEITEVHKREARRVNQDQENFTIPDSEITSFLLASGGIGVITTCCALVNGGGQGRLELVLEGHLRLHYGNPPQIFPEGAAEISLPTEPIPTIDAAFIDAIRRRDPSPIRSTYADGLKTAAVTIAANQSAREGRPVAVPAV